MQHFSLERIKQVQKQSMDNIVIQEVAFLEGEIMREARDGKSKLVKDIRSYELLKRLMTHFMEQEFAVQTWQERGVWVISIKW